MAQNAVGELLRRSFRPEFLNRLDEIIYFKPLTRENIGEIVELSLASLSARLAEKQLSLELTESAKAYVIEKGYNPVFGARPLKRFIGANVETLIARLIIAEDIEPGAKIVIDYDGLELTAKIK